MPLNHYLLENQPYDYVVKSYVFRLLGNRCRWNLNLVAIVIRVLCLEVRPNRKQRFVSTVTFHT